MELTPLGKVEKVTGYADLVKDVLKDNPIANQFAGGGSDKAALTGFQDQYVIFQDKAIKPGDTLESPYKIELAQKIGEFDGKRIYTFGAPDKVGETPTLKISITVELSGELDIDTGQSQVSGDIELDDLSGTIQFDPVDGRIVTLESEQTMSGDLTVEVAGETDHSRRFRTDRQTLPQIGRQATPLITYLSQPPAEPGARWGEWLNSQLPTHGGHCLAREFDPFAAQPHPQDPAAW